MMKEVTRETFTNECLRIEKSIVYFYRQTCPPCKETFPHLEEQAKALDWNVCMIDVEKYPDIADKYGAMATPTLIFFYNGEETHRRVGMCNKECLTENYNFKKGEGLPLYTNPSSIYIPQSGKAIIEFVKSGCSNSKTMEDKVKKYAKENRDVMVFVSEPDQKMITKFELKGAPTFIGFIDGKEINKISGIVKDIGLCLNERKEEDIPITRLDIIRLKALTFDQIRKVNNETYILQQLNAEISRRENGTKV